MNKKIEFTKEKAVQFVKDYNDARKNNAASFLFDGNEIVIGYAYYLIQYLEMRRLITGKFDNDKIYQADETTN